MDRRAFLATLLFALAALAAIPSRVLAQPSKALPRVTMLFPGSPVQPNQLANAFLEAMRENGYTDGQDFAFDLRYVSTRGDELERVIADLLPLRPDVIVTIGSPAAWAQRRRPRRYRS